MPIAYITIKTETDGGLRTLHESLSRSDLTNEVFCDHLLERMRWAVEDTIPPRTEASTAPVGETLLGGILHALHQRETVGT